MQYHLKLPNCCWPNVEKLPLVPIAVEGNPDLPRPVPMPMALPMYAELGNPFSFSSGSSLSPPTIPISARFTFLAANCNGAPG